MNTTKKLVIAVVALALALVAFASVTVAWLSAQSSTVTNTFTAGKVAIKLDEAKVNEYGDPVDNNGAAVALANAPRVTENAYKLIPGEAYTKDPKVYILKDSEPCYVFVKVENALEGIIDKTNNNSIEEQMKTLGWIQLDDVTNVWYYKETVDAREEEKTLQVFNNFTLVGGLTNVAGETPNISDYENATIKVTAYAVQSANMTDAADAWTKAFGTN